MGHHYLCTWVWRRLGSTPLIIDTDGTWFNLTSAADGVKFDFYGTGTPIQIAWTAKGSTNGWLALPKNGQITSARDLFGNLTAQPLTNSHPPNGFAALAIYDTPAYGGNNNGVIDRGTQYGPACAYGLMQTTTAFHSRRSCTDLKNSESSGFCCTMNRRYTQTNMAIVSDTRAT